MAQTYWVPIDAPEGMVIAVATAWLAPPASDGITRLARNVSPVVQTASFER